MSGSPRWRVERVAGSVAQSHAADLTGPGATRLARIHDVRRAALVLGSGQPEASLDRAALDAAGVEVVRRHSGGGAVLLAPGDVVWIDVVVPAGDPLWCDDVRRAFHWLGATWQRALARHGTAAIVHTGSLVSTRWSPLVCFAGLGPGEVTVAGRKVVGISQRRTRDAARFQCAALLRWDVVGIVRLLALGADARAEALAELEAAATGLPIAGDDLLSSFLASLP